MGKLKFAVTCSSNMNRSMEAHSYLSKKGFDVSSFGSGNQVKLPGPSPDKPNIYDFETPYADIYKDLVTKDKNAYTQNGILHMLDRNRRIKQHPERFQDHEGKFDVIICLEERVYDQVVEDLSCRDSGDGSCVHVINMDIQDNHEEATIGAFFVCELCAMLEACDDLDNEIDELLTEFEIKCDRNILHTVGFY